MTKRIDSIMSELAKYTVMQEETNAIIESLKDELKEIMTKEGVDTLRGTEHKATWKVVTANRFDGTAFKASHPKLYADYVKQTTSKRFNFQ